MSRRSRTQLRCRKRSKRGNLGGFEPSGSSSQSRTDPSDVDPTQSHFSYLKYPRPLLRLSLMRFKEDVERHVYRPLKKKKKIDKLKGREINRKVQNPWERGGKRRSGRRQSSLTPVKGLQFSWPSLECWIQSFRFRRSPRESVTLKGDVP